MPRAKQTVRGKNNGWRSFGGSDSRGSMTASSLDSGIDEYLRERLMPVEGAIPHLPGIEMYGDSIPAGTAGGDLFEYINFQQRYDIDKRIERALRLSKEFLVPHPHPPGMRDHNSVDDHVEWLTSRADYRFEMGTAYREARSLEQVRIAEDLRDLYSTAGVLVVDAQGHGVIAARSRQPYMTHFTRLCSPNLMVTGRRHRSYLKSSICGWRSRSRLGMHWGEA